MNTKDIFGLEKIFISNISDEVDNLLKKIKEENRIWDGCNPIFSCIIQLMQ